MIISNSLLVLTWAFLLWRQKTNKTLAELSAFEFAFNVLNEASLFKPVFIGLAGAQPGRISTQTMELYLESNVFETESQQIDHFLSALINNEAVDVDYNFELYHYVQMKFDVVVVDILCDLDSANKRPSFLF